MRSIIPLSMVLYGHRRTKWSYADEISINCAVLWNSQGQDHTSSIRTEPFIRACLRDVISKKKYFINQAKNPLN